MRYVGDGARNPRLLQIVLPRRFNVYMTRKKQSPYNRALDILAGRAHSVHEIKGKLTRKGVTVAEAEEVVSRLLDIGLLNDKTFTELYARSKLVGGAASVRRIQQELARKGISAEMAQKAIERTLEEEKIDPFEALERVAEKKFRQMRNLDPQVAKRRLFGFLARRGYNMDDINSVVYALFNDNR